MMTLSKCRDGTEIVKQPERIEMLVELQKQLVGSMEMNMGGSVV